MSKINDEIENPIDIKTYKIVKKHLPFYYELGLTPNHITTLSLITGILSGKMLYDGNKLLSIILLCFSYYFDCADGALARKYKMFSEFGDYYDHVADFVKFGFILYYMYTKNANRFVDFLPYMLLLILLISIQMGCQERYMEDKKIDKENESNSLSTLKFLCPNKEYIKYTKYFGVGSFILSFCIILYLF